MNKMTEKDPDHDNESKRDASWCRRCVVESSMLAHPFHIHGAYFQVLSENGSKPRIENQGWKDTVLVEQQVEILVKFDHAAVEQKPFMFHCHILEHEDAGMMGQFSVI